MEVLDTEHYAWTLFRSGDTLVLDANCNHGAFGYTFAIELSEKEDARYRTEGRSYLSKLAHDIHFSAPIVEGNRSIYKNRGVSRKFHSEMSDAIQTWKKERDKNTEGEG